MKAIAMESSKVRFEKEMALRNADYNSVTLIRLAIKRLKDVNDPIAFTTRVKEILSMEVVALAKEARLDRA